MSKLNRRQKELLDRFLVEDDKLRRANQLTANQWHTLAAGNNYAGLNEDVTQYLRDKFFEAKYGGSDEAEPN